MIVFLIATSYFSTAIFAGTLSSVASFLSFFINLIT